MLKAWGSFAVFALLLVMACCGGLMLGPLSGNSSDQITAARQKIEHVLGLQIVLSGPVEFHAFPRPYVSVGAIAVTDTSGAVALDIPDVTATIGIGPLLLRRVVVEDVTVTGLTGVFHAEAVASRWRSGITALDLPDWAQQMPKKLLVTAGVLEMRSDNSAASGLVTDLQIVMSGAPAGAVVLNGRGNWRGSQIELAGQLETVSSLLRGEPATGFLKFKSHDLSLSLTGTLAEGWRGRFTGVVAASTPSLPRLLRLVGMPSSNTAGVQHASFTGSAETTDEDVTIANARLVLNTTALEGTVALQRNGGLVGTLATDVLDITPLLAGLPPPLDAAGGWNAAAFEISPASLHDLDLRISANRVELGGFRADDAAFSVLCRNRRMELSLGEARAYGGLVKARLVASGVEDEMQVKIDASASQLQLDHMADIVNAMSGQVGGSATASLAVEGGGDNLRAIVASMRGHGQITIRQGHFPSLGPSMRPVTAEGRAVADSKVTTFDFVSASGEISKGIATIREGSITTPEGRLVLSGRASLIDRTFHLQPASSSAAGDAFDVPPPQPADLADGAVGSVATRVGPKPLSGLPRSDELNEGGYLP